MRIIRIVMLSACVAALPQAARAQNVSGADGDWHVNVYPVLAWVPIGITIDVNVPPIQGGEGDSGGILDSRLDGAFFAGAAASNGPWRIDGYGLWARIGGDRPERPTLAVDVDLIYGSARVGRRVAPDLYLTGGLRRVAIKYDVSLGNLPRLSRKPGVWDPIVGIGWHRAGRSVEWHATLDGGGFGVGSDVDLAASASLDWKPISHFGFAAGYNVQYLKITDSVASRDLTLKMTLHGPMIGIGLYF